MSRIPPTATHVLIGCVAMLVTACATTGGGHAAFPVGDYQRGDVVISLDADGTTLGSTVDGADWSRGTYTVAGDRLTVVDNWMAASHRAMGCVGKGAGTYRWSLAGDQLVLALVADPCAARATGITSGAWMRRQAGRPRDGA